MQPHSPFDGDAARYDRFRPGYPAALFEDLLSYAALSGASHALEIGVGTGQATAPILGSGCRVTAVELGVHLAAFAAQKYSACERFSLLCGDFMRVDLPAGAFDLVNCASAFHWLPQAQGLERAMTLLRPGGSVALFWNHPYPNRLDDEGNLVNRRVYARHRPGERTPGQFTEKDCLPRADALRQAGFVGVETRLYRRVRTLSTGDYLGLINTYSDHLALPPGRRAAFERDMRRELDAVGGRINVYDTIDLYLGRKPG